MSKNYLKRAVQFLPFSLATNGPVVLTTGANHPSLVAASLGLLMLLTNDTIAKPSAAPAFDISAEKNRLQKLMITSDFNRTVRISMGSINVLSALLYIIRVAQRNEEDQDLLSGEPAQWILTAWSCLIGAVWISSGWYGQ
mmetsp:Transcript_6416/g.8129  ORF Transcript_6416/g.8129 Transcript_6416/m.8129 type:complete len:140 (-) Transcript_6416:1145-1564(-)